jgi:hypothetical protein
MLFGQVHIYANKISVSEGTLRLHFGTLVGETLECPRILLEVKINIDDLSVGGRSPKLNGPGNLQVVARNIEEQILNMDPSAPQTVMKGVAITCELVPCVYHSTSPVS